MDATKATVGSSSNALRSAIATACCALLASPLMLNAQTALPKSYATIRSNPQASCGEADANGEANRCKVKRICVNNQSGAVLTVHIGTFGRNDSDTAATKVSVGGEVCKGVFVYGQDGGAIGIFTITALDSAFKEHAVSMPSTVTAGAFTPVNYNRTPTTVNGLPYYQKQDNWPQIGPKPTFPDTEKGTWKLTVYGRVLPTFNFCGSNNKAESAAMAVQSCTWTVN
jgi:hypothetical protein